MKGRVIVATHIPMTQPIWIKVGERDAADLRHFQKDVGTSIRLESRHYGLQNRTRNQGVTHSRLA